MHREREREREKRHTAESSDWAPKRSGRMPRGLEPGPRRMLGSFFGALGLQGLGC